MINKIDGKQTSFGTNVSTLRKYCNAKTVEDIGSSISKVLDSLEKDGLDCELVINSKIRGYEDGAIGCIDTFLSSEHKITPTILIKNGNTTKEYPIDKITKDCEASFLTPEPRNYENGLTDKDLEKQPYIKRFHDKLIQECIIELTPEKLKMKLSELINENELEIAKLQDTVNTIKSLFTAQK